LVRFLVCRHFSTKFAHLKNYEKSTDSFRFGASGETTVAEEKDWPLAERLENQKASFKRLRISPPIFCLRSKCGGSYLWSYFKINQLPKALFPLNLCFEHDLNTKMKKNTKDLNGVPDGIFKAQTEFVNISTNIVRDTDISDSLAMFLPLVLKVLTSSIFRVHLDYCLLFSLKMTLLHQETLRLFSVWRN